MSDEVNIERCTANENFAIIPNEILQHPTMSADATTVLVYLLSCKPEWVVKPKNVWKAKSLSRDRVYKAFDELIELGYMLRTEERLGNLKNKTSYKVAYFKKFLRRPESRDTESRDTENQDALIKTKCSKNDRANRSVCSDSASASPDSPNLSANASSSTPSSSQSKPEPQCPETESDLSVPSVIVITTVVDNKQKQLKITQSELYHEITRKRKSKWRIEDIEEAWQILANYTGKLYDWWRYFESTVEKLEAKRKHNGAMKRCKVKSQTEKEPSQTEKPPCSESATERQPSVLAKVLAGFQACERGSQAPTK